MAPVVRLFTTSQLAVEVVFMVGVIAYMFMTWLSTVLQRPPRLLLLLLLISLLLATNVASRSRDATATSTLCDWTPSRRQRQENFIIVGSMYYITVNCFCW